ncbi:interleukin-12 receptor subunit beta-2 [Cottoperca gobio]|uniref:Interleukin-12 receptor subunit beta-2 n=1 Tax=Cottoperca gobio TaxID=56716 RepID=A0A6J2PK47_COTGO|nr:interleukin-12 receptor subunit beta-2-like [Cottoperca gobio]
MMATMSQTWTIFTAVIVMAVQCCRGEKCCHIWSSAGPVVQQGSNFTVNCNFTCKCKGSMRSGHPPRPQTHTEINPALIYLNVTNITKKRTFSCECNCPTSLNPCGLDISTGYLPEPPKNISCTYKVKDNEREVVLCTWDRGRDTFLTNKVVLWLRTVSRNHTDGLVLNSKETALESASIPVSSSVQLISVWVLARNELGSAVSITMNYTLRDIAMPSTPVLGQPDCSSRECIIKVQHSVRTQHLEIQYRAEAQTWASSPDSVVQMSSVKVPSLEPYTLHHFRARTKFSTGLWSKWSTNISSWTQEEAPAKELDVWYAEPASDFKSLRVYWKELNISTAKGKIIVYQVRVYSPNSGPVSITNVSADTRNCSVPFCANCEVTVWACNSKGSSPPAKITIHHTKVKVKQFQSPEDMHVTVDRVTISWRKHDTAPRHAVYVVEWYPEGHKLEELRWVKLGRNDNHTVVTGIKPFECYEGAVYVLSNESLLRRTTFTGVTSLESAPVAGPSVQHKVEGNQVKVTWTEIPRGQRRGCLTNYIIYLENDSGHKKPYIVPASQRMHIIKGLSSVFYNLWITASTAQGEGPEGQKVKFLIQNETPLSPLIMCAVAATILMFLVCLCHSLEVKQRFWVYFQCLMLDVVPDPANSKWAREYTQEKGKISLQLSNSSVTAEEDEPILVDVEELPKQSIDICANVSSQLPRQTSLSPETEPAALLYPLTTYIKSFSHDSDNSDQPQTSLDTNTTGDYLSSHGPGDMDEEDQEFVDMLGFFPSHNFFMEHPEFGGKLTLNAVKIDCSDLFQNSEC